MKKQTLGGKSYGEYEYRYVPSSRCEIRLYYTGTLELSFGPGMVRVILRGKVVSRFLRGVCYWLRECPVMGVVKKVVALSKGAGGSSSGEPPEELQLWPGLSEMLTVTKYDDGSDREPSVLILMVEGCLWKCCLTDKSNARNLWKSAASIQELLESIEETLQTGQESDWRRAQPKPQAGKKRG